jgi:hypothetical protein
VIDADKANHVGGKPPSGLSEDFLYVADIELFTVSTKIFYKGKTYNLLLFHACESSSC